MTKKRMSVWVFVLAFCITMFLFVLNDRLPLWRNVYIHAPFDGKLITWEGVEIKTGRWIKTPEGHALLAPEEGGEILFKKDVGAPEQLILRDKYGEGAAFLKFKKQRSKNAVELWIYRK